MASTTGVIFPESMATFLANPIDICFGSMPATSIAPAACLVIEGNAVTTHQHIETDLSKKNHPPTRTRLVLKKLRRPLTAAHRPRLNQESSPDRLAFQVGHTTISSNYLGESSRL
jgi:hypothetical protein